MLPRSSIFSRLARRRRPGAAFTLIELLVAAGITALIAGFIAIIVRNVSANWSRASGRLGADAQARLVLDQLQQDLQGAIYRDDGAVWFAADVVDRTTNPGNLWTEAGRNPKPTGAGAAGSVILNTPSIADARFGKAGIWLRFFTTSRGSNVVANVATHSAPVAVGYQIIRRFSATNPANQNTAYLLHRAEARPATANNRPGVLESGFNILAAAYTTANAANNNGATTGDPRSIQVPGTNQGGAGRNLDAVVADNVIDFGIRAYVYDRDRPGALRLVFPADNAGRPAGNANSRYRPTLPPHTPPAQWGGAQPYPEVVDIMVRILTDEGAAQIANLERVQNPALTVPAKYNGNAAQWWWGVATENSRVYTRRVVLQAKPF